MSGTAVLLVLALVAFITGAALALSTRDHPRVAIAVGLSLWVAAQLFGALSP